MSKKRYDYIFRRDRSNVAKVNKINVYKVFGRDRFLKPNFGVGPSLAFQSNTGLCIRMSRLARAAISVEWATHCVAAVVPASTNIAEQQV